MHVQPYLFFEGRCDEALAFYRAAIGADVTMLMRYKDAPDQGTTPPARADKVMHAAFRIGQTALMASDGNCSGQPAFNGLSLSLTASGDAEAEALFANLGDGGEVILAMAATFFASRFGMVKDRFGLTWMVTTGGGGD